MLEEVANLFTNGCAARLTQHAGSVPQSLEPFRKQGNLGALPSAFCAFKRDE